MDSVSFLQQQIYDIDVQIEQLKDKRATLHKELIRQYKQVVLQRNNLKSKDDQV